MTRADIDAFTLMKQHQQLEYWNTIEVRHGVLFPEQKQAFARIVAAVRILSRMIRVGTFLVALCWAFMSFAGEANAAEVLRMDEVKIEGELQKPQVSYILPRSSKIDLTGDLGRFRPNQSSKYLSMVKGRQDLFGRQARGKGK